MVQKRWDGEGVAGIAGRKLEAVPRLTAYISFYPGGPWTGGSGSGSDSGTLT
jgi:hypothetical protein